MEPLVVVTLTACLVTTLAPLLTKIAGRQEELEKWNQEIKRCSDLSVDAEMAGSKELYAAFQKEGNEALHKYYSALFCEAVTEFFPHVLALGIFQHLYSQDVLSWGINLWLVGEGLGAFGWYIITALVYHFAVLKKIRRRFPTLQGALHSK